MSRLFISHSSADNAVAIGIHSWLAANGWDDIFLDVDADQGLKPGMKWQEALRRAQSRCEAVLLLISPEWLASDWCRTEYLLATQLNKRVFAAMITSVPIESLPATLTAEWQIVDLTHPERDERLPGTDMLLSSVGLRKLRHGLAEAGIDATRFAWPPDGDRDRAPYPGLRALDEVDAGIFFGRDGQIVLAIDALRGLRDASTGGVFAILGASGAGKSSFLRAGLLPRLRRDDRRFHVLPVLRPARAAVSGETGLLAILSIALEGVGKGLSRADILQQLSEDPLAIMQALDGGAERCLVLSVDQAEECLDNAEGAELLAFLNIFASLPRSRFIAILAVRSDRWDALQSHPALAELSQTLFSLPPMPSGAFGDVIRGPARRMTESGRTIVVEEQLVDAMLNDLAAGGARDSLPLLAFTLEGLWREEGATGHLSLSNYRRSGGLRGAIEAAIARALRRAEQDRRIPVDTQAQLLLLRRGFIPWLAGIDPETGSPRRRVARLSEIPDEARPLIDILVEERLLTRDLDQATGETVLEPAHEALLRQWGAMGTWLGDALQDLTTVEGIRRAARDWAANARHPDWQVHADARLSLAADLVRKPDFSALLQATDHAYLDACLKTADAKQRQTKRLRMVRNGAITFAFVAISASSALLWSLWSKAEVARIDAASSLLVFEALNQREDGRAPLALDTVRSAFDLTETEVTRSALATAVMAIPDQLDKVFDMGSPAPTAIAYLPDGSLVSASTDGRATIMREGIRSLSIDLTPAVAPEDGSAPRLVAMFQTSDGMVAMFGDAAVQAMSTDGIVTLQKAGDDSAVFSAGGGIAADRSGKLFAVDDAGSLALIDCRSSPCESRPIALADAISPGSALFSFSPDGSFLTYQSQRGGRLLDLVSGLVRPLPRLIPAEAHAPIALSPDSERIAYACAATSTCIATIDDAAHPLMTLPGEKGALLDIEWSPDGRRLATLHLDGLVRIWRVDAMEDDLNMLSDLRKSSDPSVFDPYEGHRKDLEQRFSGMLLNDRQSAKSFPFDPADWTGMTSLVEGPSGQVLVLPYKQTRIAILTPQSSDATVLVSDPLPAVPTGALIDPSRDVAYVATTDGAIRRVQIDDGREGPPVLPAVSGSSPKMAATGATSLSLSPDGKLLVASVSHTGTDLSIFSTEDSSVKYRLPLDFPDPKVVAFSPDGGRLAVLLSNGQLDLWVLSSPVVRWFSVPLTGNTLPSDVAWAGPDRLAITQRDGSLRLFDTEPAAWLARAARLLQTSPQTNLQGVP